MMKKTLAAAITSAIVIGAASTTFAAANPFSDVPTDHWSFDAVAKLAQEGVIEGYGDNTFRGDAHITRYEMAQMVAKAMAKDLSGADKATVDKLAAEYADELNNLGVRVSNLEERSDNVKITGLLRLDGKHLKDDLDLQANGKEKTGQAKLRLDIDAKVNDNWHVKGRFDADTELETSSSNSVSTVRAYAEGPLFGATARFGKFGVYDFDNISAAGLVIDTEVTGAEFDFSHNDNFKTTLTYGRLASDAHKYGFGNSELVVAANIVNYFDPVGTADYAAIRFAYDANENLSFGAAYHYLKSKDSQDAFGWDEDKNSIWELGLNYKFAQDWQFGAVYASSNANPEDFYMDDQEKKSYSAQFTFKGAEMAVPHSYGLWLAYRQIGAYASIAPTYDGVLYGTKGVELGVDYVIDKNIMAKLVYFDGERVTELTDNDDKVKKLFGRVEFQF